jgi:hypothetical protein
VIPSKLNVPHEGVDSGREQHGLLPKTSFDRPSDSLTFFFCYTLRVCRVAYLSVNFFENDDKVHVTT